MRKKKIKNYTLSLLIYLGHLLACFSIFKIWNIRTFLRSFSFNSFYHLLLKRVPASSHERCRLREVIEKNVWSCGKIIATAVAKVTRVLYHR